MTIISRVVKAVVTLPILGTVSRNDKGEVVKSGERYRIHLYAAKPGMKYEPQTHTHLLVGVMDGGGYTSQEFKRSEEVLLPDGRELIALRVDANGIPLSWDSLPVEVLTALNPDELFCVNNGQVFIKNAFIGLSTYSGGMVAGITTAKSHSDKIHEIVSKYLTGEASEYTDELVDELNALRETENLSDRLAEKISECVRQSLIKEMKPGGLLYGR